MFGGAYILSLIALWLKSVSASTLPILPFAPFLTVVLLKRSLASSFILAAIAGFHVDLLSSDPFGIHALGFFFAILFCHRLRRLFSYDILSQFAIFSSIISVTMTINHLFLLFLFDRRVPFDRLWWLTDWIFFPVLDGLFAIVWFYGPLLAGQKLYRYWMFYWLKKKSLSQN